MTNEVIFTAEETQARIENAVAQAYDMGKWLWETKVKLAEEFGVDHYNYKTLIRSSTEYVENSYEKLATYAGLTVQELSDLVMKEIK